MQQETRLRNKVLVERTLGRLTQGELADLAGVTRQTIAAIEKEAYAPSGLLVFQLADILKIPVNELFWLEENVT